MNTIQTYRGEIIDFVDPDHEQINIDDISHSLSNKCRFNGHTTVFYSVATHSVHVAEMAWMIMERVEGMDSGLRHDIHKKAFMHDFSEAYISDIHTPLKKMLPAYQHIEMKTTYSIDSAFSVRYHPMTETVVKAADKMLLLIENDHLLTHSLDPAFKETMIQYFNKLSLNDSADIIIQNLRHKSYISNEIQAMSYKDEPELPKAAKERFMHYYNTKFKGKL